MNQERYDRVAAALTSLGFTEIESIAYAYLVEHSPATPYRVAQSIGKPTANTYKAVNSLFQKGLIMIDETGSRLCQAVRPDEVLSKLRSSFDDKHGLASEAFSKLERSGEIEDKIFSLSTREQVFERFRSMVENAKSVVLVDAYPGTMEKIAPWLEKAAERRVKVIVESYDSAVLGGVEIVPFPEEQRMLHRWKGDWLIAVADGAEFICAFLSDDGISVKSAIWSNNSFVALPQHSSLVHSFRASILERMIMQGATAAELKSEVERSRHWVDLAKLGYQKLSSEFADEL